MSFPSPSAALSLAAALSAAILFGGPAGGSARDVAAPTIFAPGIISGPGYDSAPAFSPDGKTVWFSRSDGKASTIMVSRRVHGTWEAPVVASFSGKWNNMEPTMSPDGKYMIFVSNRPVDGSDKPIDGFFNGKSFPERGGNLWRVDRSGTGWGEPRRLPEIVNSSRSTFAPSIAANGNLYFMRPAADEKGRFQLFRARFVHGTYQQPEPLSFSDGSVTTVDPAVAPDESFIVFGSGYGPAHDMELFLAFGKDGKWETPGNLGGAVNAPGSDAEARLGPDHRTLYFSSQRRVEGSSADWNNDAYNIWSVSLTPWLNRSVPLGGKPGS